MKSPAFTLYVKDVLCSPRLDEMNANEFKAYWFLLMNSWLQIPRATLPNDDFKLMRLSRVSSKEEWDAVKSTVLAMFSPTPDGRLANDRLLEESERQFIRHKQREDAIKRRWDTKRHTKPHTGSLTKHHTKTDTAP